MTITCSTCNCTVTLPLSADGSIDVSRAPIGAAAHGATREARERETLASRPRLEPHT
jgi:hypothetical protein